MSLRMILPLVLAGMSVGGCSGPPADNPLLRSVRYAYATALLDSAAVVHANDQFERARFMIEVAEETHERGEPEELVMHYVYLAQRQLDVAHEHVRQVALWDATQTAEYELREIRLVAREEIALLAESRARLEGLRADSARREAEAAIARAEQIQYYTAGLEVELTNRGLALTIEDFLFEDGQASLRPGADQALNSIISFLNEYRTRRILIEGHSDPGSNANNAAQLSQRRADAIRALLIRRGISADRITALGLGDRYPITNNETPANRRINRRVEIIISDAEGVIPPRNAGNR